MKIEFKFTIQYERALNPKSSLSNEIISRSISLMDKYWNENGESIRKILKELTGLSFTKKEIICYLNSKESLSDPLSVKIEKISDMQDNLIHELIHVLLIQNYNKPDEKFKVKWDSFWKEYENETPLCRSHIIVHAIHFLIAQKMNPRRLNRLKTYSEHPDYVRSWEIVNEIGAEKIVSKYLLGKTDLKNI